MIPANKQFFHRPHRDKTGPSPLNKMGCAMEASSCVKLDGGMIDSPHPRESPSRVERKTTHLLSREESNKLKKDFSEALEVKAWCRKCASLPYSSEILLCALVATMWPKSVGLEPRTQKDQYLHIKQVSVVCLLQISCVHHMLLMPVLALQTSLSVSELPAKCQFILMGYREASVPNEREEGGTNILLPLIYIVAFNSYNFH